MDGRGRLILRAFLRMLPALMFAIVFIGGVYTLFALDEHSWWKPLIVLVAVPLVSGYVTRAWRRRHPRPTDQSDDGGLAFDDAPIDEHHFTSASRRS